MRKFEPRSYQPGAIAHLHDVKYSALWADMGLGKTVCALTAVSELQDELHTRRVLVIAPLRVAQMVWQQEAALWEHLKHLRVQLIRDKNPSVRLQQALSEADVHVINFDLLVWLVKALDGKWPWDTVIVDEASKLKDPKSWRSRALWHVRPLIRHFKQLTGTPAGNGLLDLYGQVLLLDKGDRLGRTEHQFKQRWFTKEDRDGRVWTPKPGALEYVVEACRDICYSLRAEDYLDLPPMIMNTVYVELPPKAKTQYAKLHREMYLELESGAVDSVNAAVATGKCQQFANGAIWLNEEDERKWVSTHDAKLEALQEVLDNTGGEPVLVAYHYKHDLAKLQAAFPNGEALSTDPDVIKRWNQGKIPLLFAHPKSAGHGLNLQWGGRTLVFYSLTWSLEDYEQIIERIGPVRQLQAGLNRTVYVHLIVAKDTIDEVIARRLETRASVQSVLKNAMRRGLG